MDIQLNEQTGDLVIDNRDFTLTKNESESIRQKLIIKLLTFKNEWFLNSELGIPYHQNILGKNRSKETIDSIFQAAILEEPQVLEISQFRSTVDRANRVYSLSFTIRTTNASEAIPIELTI